MKLLAIAFLLISTPAWGIDFSQVISDADNRPICTLDGKEECPDDKKFTLALAVRNALFASYEDERNLSGEEKYKRAEIAFAIGKGGEVALKAEDIAVVKRVVGKAYPPLIVRQVWNMLEAKK